MTMSKQVLDIEQMKHLNELGLDTSKASMQYVANNNDIIFVVPKECGYHIKDVEDGYIICDALTLQDILDILPKEMTDKDGYKFVLKIEYGLLSRVWHIGYYYYDVASTGNLYSGDNPIDTVYKMLCWCIEKGYLKVDKA